MDEIIYVISLSLFLTVAVGLFGWTLYHLFGKTRKTRWKFQQLQLQSGVFLLIILALVSYLLIYLFYQYDWVMMHLSGLFSCIIIAQCGLSVYSLADHPKITFKIALSHLLIPVLLPIGWVVICSFGDDMREYATWVLVAAWVYYIVYCVSIFAVSMRNSRQFLRRLEDSYVEIEKRQVMYRTRAIFFCVTILFFWMVYVIAPSYIVHSLYFLFSIVGWSYFAYVIIHMKDSPIANRMPKTEEEVKEEEEVPDPTQNELLFDSPVMQRLNEQLDEVLRKGDLYLDPDLDINMLSQALCTNRTYLGRLLRMRGSTFSRYINSMRLNHAEELLRTTNKNVSEICHECGFSDATFRRVFTDRYNCTPVEYRRMVQMANM